MQIKLRQPTRLKIFNLILPAVAIALLLSVFLHLTSAQQTLSGKSIEVSPPSQEISADPGKTVEVKAKVTNQSDQPINLNVSIDDFTAQGDEGQVSLEDQGNNSLSGWSKITPNNFTLEAGQTQEVVASISIPQGVAGGQYGAFVFSSGGSSAVPNTASLSQQIASLFLIKVSGPINENVLITKFTSPSFAEFGPIPMQIEFQNLGNIHERPHGLINVTDMFGRTTKDIVFTGENILPGASRIVDTSLDNQWLLGPFKAQSILYYGSKNETLIATTSFFVFPVRLAIVVLIVLFILFKLRRRLVKAFKILIK